MAFTVNQVRHFYVANKPTSGDLVVKHEGTEVTDKLSDAEANGAIKLHVNEKANHIYFEYKSPGGVVRTDLINLSQISYIKHIKAKDMRHPLKRVKVSFEGNPTFKGEAVLRVTFNRFLTMSEENKEFAVTVHIEDSATPSSDYYKEMALSLAKTIERSFPGMVQVDLETGGTGVNNIVTLVPVKANTKKASLSATYTGLVVTELPQPWERGLVPQGLGIDFDFTGFVKSDTKVNTVSYVAPKDLDTRAIKNGCKIADMEWYYHGARGDMYRGANYPYHFITEYVADPTKEYDVLELHYAFSDQGTLNYNSEKDITIAAATTEVTDLKAAILEAATNKKVVIEEV